MSSYVDLNLRGVYGISGHRYRRVLVIGVLPLLPISSEQKAMIAVMFAICSIALYREMRPFERMSTNILACAVQYTLLLVFGSSLAIEANLTTNLPSTGFGLILTLCTLAIFILTIAHSTYVYYQAPKQEFVIWSGMVYALSSCRTHSPIDHLRAVAKIRLI